MIYELDLWFTNVIYDLKFPRRLKPIHSATWRLQNENHLWGDYRPRYRGLYHCNLNSSSTCTPTFNLDFKSVPEQLAGMPEATIIRSLHAQSYYQFVLSTYICVTIISIYRFWISPALPVSLTLKLSLCLLLTSPRSYNFTKSKK